MDAVKSDMQTTRQAELCLQLSAENFQDASLHERIFMGFASGFLKRILNIIFPLGGEA
jgi:hypothetical protein